MRYLILALLLIASPAWAEEREKEKRFWAEYEAEKAQEATNGTAH